MTERHCFSYVNTDIPPGVSIHEFRRSRVNARRGHGWSRRARSERRHIERAADAHITDSPGELTVLHGSGLRARKSAYLPVPGSAA